jgi:hypothetical protein
MSARIGMIYANSIYSKFLSEFGYFRLLSLLKKRPLVQASDFQWRGRENKNREKY